MIVERHFETTGQRNLSPYMADQFADLAILARVMHEFELYLPWASTFEDDHEVIISPTLNNATSS